MRKNKITCPDKTCFETEITMQVGDLNYGGHVGNERYLLFAQETRIRFLESIGYSEMKFGPYGLVVSEASIEYLQELFHGDCISISMSIESLSRVGFDCFHTISTQRNGTKILVAKLMIGMVCYDYAARKLRSIPEDIKAKLKERISSL